MNIYLRVSNAMLKSLVIQEIKHVLDGQGKGRATVGGAEDGLKQVVNKLLQRQFSGQESCEVDF